jgi:hypothetical protein
MKLLVDVNGDSSWEVSERFKGKQVSIQKFMPNPIRVVMDKKVCCINPDLASINLSNSMCTRPEVSCANSIAKLKDLHSKIGWFLIPNMY